MDNLDGAERVAVAHCRTIARIVVVDMA